jgi:hypothetical protein
MELFVPSVLLLILAGLVIFAILPNVAPLTLAILTTFLLATVGYHHYTLFAHEYAQSTWQTTVYNASVPFLIAMLTLFMIGFGLNMIRSRVFPGSTNTRMNLTAPSTAANLSSSEERFLQSLIRRP